MEAILERAWENGDIYKSDYEGYYCVDCEEYKVCDGSKNKYYLFTVGAAGGVQRTARALPGILKETHCS